jgi:hypothetical protein
MNYLYISRVICILALLTLISKNEKLVCTACSGIMYELQKGCNSWNQWSKQYLYIVQLAHLATSAFTCIKSLDNLCTFSSVLLWITNAKACDTQFLFNVKKLFWKYLPMSPKYLKNWDFHYDKQRSPPNWKCSKSNLLP